MTTQRSPTGRLLALAAGLALLGGCAIPNEALRAPARPAIGAAEGRALVARSLPGSLAERNGWATDIYAAITYYPWHRAEVDAYLNERRALADKVRQENETRYSPAGVCERLLTRRDQ